ATRSGSTSRSGAIPSARRSSRRWPPRAAAPRWARWPAPSCARPATRGAEESPRPRIYAIVGRPLPPRHQTPTLLAPRPLGAAIVRGLRRSGRLAPTQILGTARRPEVVRALREKHKIRTTNHNLEACRGAAVVLVCVKPHEVAPLLHTEEMREALAGKLVIS